MRYTIGKTFDFEYSHRLVLPYKSPCQSLHGHTGKVDFSIGGDFVELNPESMVLDFTDFKDFINNIVKRTFDHATLINEKDLDLINYCNKHNFKYCVFNGNPTSELIAQTITKMLADYLILQKNILKIKLIGSNRLMLSVKFWETQNSYVDYWSFIDELYQIDNPLLQVFECDCVKDKKFENNKNKKNEEHKKFINKIKECKKEYNPFNPEVKPDPKPDENRPTMEGPDIVVISGSGDPTEMFHILDSILR